MPLSQVFQAHAQRAGFTLTELTPPAAPAQPEAEGAGEGAAPPIPPPSASEHAALRSAVGDGEYFLAMLVGGWRWGGRSVPAGCGHGMGAPCTNRAACVCLSHTVGSWHGRRCACGCAAFGGATLLCVCVCVTPLRLIWLLLLLLLLQPDGTSLVRPIMRGGYAVIQGVGAGGEWRAVAAREGKCIGVQCAACPLHTAISMHARLRLLFPLPCAPSAPPLTSVPTYACNTCFLPVPLFLS